MKTLCRHCLHTDSVLVHNWRSLFELVLVGARKVKYEGTGCDGVVGTLMMMRPEYGSYQLDRQK